MDINQKITEELGVKKWQVDAAVKLIDEGNTIPFIARYRKEAHGTLDDEQLRKLYERLTYLRNLEEKKEQVLASIEAMIPAHPFRLIEQLIASPVCSDALNENRLALLVRRFDLLPEQHSAAACEDHLPAFQFQHSLTQ